MTAEVYRAAGALLAERGLLQGVADEGGWWPAFGTNEEALDCLVRAIERAGYHAGRRGRDLARRRRLASSAGSGRYRLALEGRELDSDGLVEMLLGWVARYPDPLGRGSRSPRTTTRACAGFTAASATGSRSSATTSWSPTRRASPRRRRRRLQPRADQAEPGRHADRDAGPRSMRRARPASARSCSARSGETEDVTIAHLAVGWDAGQLKVGSFDALRAHGQVERDPAHRGGARHRRALRRTRRVCVSAPRFVAAARLLRSLGWRRSRARTVRRLAEDRRSAGAFIPSSASRRGEPSGRHRRAAPRR